MSLENNPFLSLFDSREEAKRYIEQAFIKTPPSQDDAELSAITSGLGHDVEQRHLLENIFLLSADESNKNLDRLHLADLKNVTPELVREATLSFFVCERVMASTEIRELLKTRPRAKHSPAYETDPMKYLAESFTRLLHSAPDPDKIFGPQSELDTDNIWLKCWVIIRDQAMLLFEVPDLLQDFSPIRHLSGLMQPININSPETDDQLQFYAILATHFATPSPPGADGHPQQCIDRVVEIFRPILEDLSREVDEMKETNFQNFHFPTSIFFFSRNASLALALLEFERASIQKRSFEKSIFTGILSLGAVPKYFNWMSEYLDDPRSVTQKFVDNLETGVQGYLEEIQGGMYEMFHRLLKLGTDVKNKLLLWIGNALHSCKDRNKLWNVHMSILNGISSDAFLLNLQVVLLKLFSPVMINPNSPKILQIQPSYCSALTGDRTLAELRGIHMIEIPGTRLIPSSDIESSTEEKYSMTTEMFFMIHTCCSTGFSVVHEKFIKLNQEIHQIRERYQELLDQGLGSSEPGIRLKEQLQLAFPMFYSCKASLLQPDLIQNMFRFSVVTANLLVNVAMSTSCHDKQQSKELKRASFPPPTDTSGSALRDFPEFVVQNVHNCLLLLRRFKDSFFEDNHESLGYLFDFILLFMSGPQFIHNPHIRAEMTEALECLFPRNDQNQAQQSIFNSLLLENFHREKLLVEHRSASYITTSLMSLFVGMELTGHGVQFENKFKYRQPMYIMFKYLWKLELHKMALVELATYAENHLDDMDAPLFLRFINLLINDAIYLLDEALSLMSQIKEKQASRDAGEWDSMPPNQRQETENTFRHLVLMSRFHNIAGIETIETLDLLTSTIHAIFIHPVMVDRLAAMLNYFLLHLVGPKKRNLKVKNPEEYKFEPKRLVVEICRIYENLSEDEDFLRAVSSDGRSYSHDLFGQASDVLCKIKEPVERIENFNRLADRIKALAVEQAEEDEGLGDVPDDFLDPIVGTLMKDPVLLPSSGKIVDRQTIARHVLSDQSDPFNRQPLTMDMVKPAEELRSKIKEWIANSKNH